jgi:hypothetical protein
MSSRATSSCGFPNFPGSRSSLLRVPVRREAATAVNFTEPFGERALLRARGYKLGDTLK